MLCMTFALYSQKKASFGIKVGANYSTISNMNLDPQWGLLIGAFVNIQHSSFYAMQPELMYSRQGGRSRFEDQESIEIDYVSLGLTNKFFVMKDERLHFLVGVNLDFDFDDNIIWMINKGFNDDVFFFDIAFYGGLGYQFDIGLTLETRYKQGTIEVFTDDFFNDERNHLNAMFQFSVAYKFDF